MGAELAPASGTFEHLHCTKLGKSTLGVPCCVVRGSRNRHTVAL